VKPPLPPESPVKPPQLLDDTKPAEPQPYARITALRGSVQYRLTETKPWRWADVGTPLPVTAQVRTGLNSTVTIVVLPDARTTIDKMKVVNVRDMSSKSGSWRPVPPIDDGTRLAGADEADEASPRPVNGPVYGSYRLREQVLLTLVFAQAKKGDLFNEDDEEKPASKSKDKDNAKDKAKQAAPSTPARKGGDLFNEDDEEKPAAKDKTKQPAPPAAKGNIFDDDEDIKSAKPQPTTPKPPAKGIFDEDEDDVKPKPPSTPGTGTPGTPSTAAPTIDPKFLPTPMLPPEQRVAAGGWYMDEAAFAIRYRPVGHANPFLRQWLTLTAGAAAAPRKVPHSAGKIAFDAMRADVGANCVKCHSIDEHPDHKEPGAVDKVFSWADPAGAGHGPLVINWQTKQPAVDYRPFVRFNHRPHRSLPELQDCKVCHSVVKGEVIAKYQSLDPHDFREKQVGFQPVLREKCATCHQQNLAGDSCLKCHNYHISDALRR
jgi:hypothetical protein